MMMNLMIETRKIPTLKLRVLLESMSYIKEESTYIDFDEYLSRELIEEKEEFGYRLYLEKFKDDIELEVSYNLNDDYIGDKETAIQLCEKRGIRPELITPDSVICQIGKCVDKDSEDFDKWFGWSHRAIYGFAIGDVVGEGDITSGRLPEGFEAKTEDDTREMSIAFAKGVA